MAANTKVLRARGTFRSSVRMSVYSVPVMLTTTTVSQYGNGRYRSSRICQARTAARTAVKITEVASSPTPNVMLIQSAKLSPTVVHRILMIQNHRVTSGTLFNSVRFDTGVSVLVMTAHAM